MVKMVSSREQQSNKVESYVLENFMNTQPPCSYNCRLTNSKTNVDTETALIRGKESEPVDNTPTPVATNKVAPHYAQSYEPEFGEQTRISKSCYFERTLDRFDPVDFQNNTYDNQTLLGAPSRWIAKYA
jgi:hypothetical protein